MLGGGVVDDEVHDEPHAPGVDVVQEGNEVLHRPEQGVYGPVVADVVAVVLLGRGVDGGEPDRIDSEALQVVEARAHAPQIADAVGIGVLEAARVHLVDDAGQPPLAAGRLVALRRNKRGVESHDVPW